MSWFTPLTDLSRTRLQHIAIAPYLFYDIILISAIVEHGLGADNAPGRTEPSKPGDAPVASDSYTSNVGIDRGASNVPGEKGAGGDPSKAGIGKEGR